MIVEGFFFSVSDDRFFREDSRQVRMIFDGVPVFHDDAFERRHSGIIR